EGGPGPGRDPELAPPCPETAGRPPSREPGTARRGPDAGGAAADPAGVRAGRDQASSGHPRARPVPDRAPGPALGRVAAAILVAAVAFLASALWAQRSPDVGDGEAAIVQVARGTAQAGGLAWHGGPVADRPPLALAAHGGWLSLTGRVTGQVVSSVEASRLASSAFRALAIVVLVVLVLALTDPRQHAALRFLVGIAAGLLAAVDPVLVGAGRTVTLEAPGLLTALLVLWLAWLLRDRPPAVYVPVVGLGSGVALLTDGRTVVLLAVPLVFGVLARARGEAFAGRALAALLVGAGFWAAFAAWALAAAPGTAGWPHRLAVLVHLAGSEQSAPLGRPLALTAPRDLATLIVLAAALPGLAALRRWRSDRASLYVLAWNLAGLGAGAALLAGGALDESWLTYLLPGAIVAAAAGFEAARTRLSTGRRLLGGSSAAVAMLLACALLAVAGAGWERRYGHADEALARMSGVVAGGVQACSALNASSTADADLFSIGGRRVTQFSSGPAAVAHGVRYFLLRSDDVAERRGTMSGGLPDWLRSTGRPVAAIPSPSHGSVQLWRVSQPATSRVADLLRVPGGVFENVLGSGCGGYAVVDAHTGRFFSGYQALGGKPVIGRPLSSPWEASGSTMQAFDTMMLRTVPDPGG
ncbi:MAG TPA: hypothetical protein VEP73_04275, partial [Actinomycetota bacterium]|nr:hypothetical protein [Actinomycetota bacterium]